MTSKDQDSDARIKIAGFSIEFFFTSVCMLFDRDFVARNETCSYGETRVRIPRLIDINSTFSEFSDEDNEKNFNPKTEKSSIIYI